MQERQVRKNERKHHRARKKRSKGENGKQNKNAVMCKGENGERSTHPHILTRKSYETKHVRQ